MSYKLGIDVGGTFTDFFMVDQDGNTAIQKVLSTPSRPADAVLEGLRKLAGSETQLNDFLGNVELIVHGTTITTNAVLTGNFSKTGYLTTKGFRDLLNERRGIKRNAFTAKEEPPVPIVPRYLIQRATERINCQGDIVEPLRESDVYEAAQFFKEKNVEAVAINFLFSFMNPYHENRAKEILQEELPDTYICSSSDVLPQMRVYERGSTTVFNASVGPILRNYVNDLVQRLTTGGFNGTLRLMQSNGGVMSPDVALNFSVNTLLSGPASAPVAGMFYAGAHGIKNIVTGDMGGTSFDCCLIENSEPEITSENTVAEYAMAMPSLAIHTLGSGGGSVAWIDSSGVPRVGPKSAGAKPGPVCYDMGGDEPTVTDADLVLGYLNPDNFLGGQKKLDSESARKIVKEKFADKLDMGLAEAAYGIYQIVNANMADGIKVASVSRGTDPRSCLYIVAGGAGSVHSCPIADELGMELILIPKSSSVFCASGMLISNLRHDFISSCYMLINDCKMDTGLVNEHLSMMKAKANKLFDAENIHLEKRKYIFSFDLRYEGQFNEIETQYSFSNNTDFGNKDISLLQKSFDERHDKLYGYSLPDTPLELVTLRLQAEGLSDKPVFREVPNAGEDSSAALSGEREIYFDGKTYDAKVYDGTRMKNGNFVSGPAIVEEPTTTILVAPNYDLCCDSFNNYLLFHKGKRLSDILKKFQFV